MKSKEKSAWDKFWNILWKDDSPKGWILSLIIIFIFIKLIFFPALNLITGTQLPLVVIESCSMYHDGDLFSEFDNWWENKKIKYASFDLTKLDFETFIFPQGFNKGDILFVLGTPAEKIKLGDIIIFDSGQRHPVIHRVVEIKGASPDLTFSTIGDNVASQHSFEKDIHQDQLIGRASFKTIPLVGWVKLIGSDLLNKVFCLDKTTCKNDFYYINEGLCKES